MSVSHLPFLDDKLTYCDAKEEQLRYLKGIMLWFHAVSGLKLKLRKVELIHVGVYKMRMHWLLFWLSIKSPAFSVLRITAGHKLLS